MSSTVASSLARGSIVVDDENTQLAYTDSGIPTLFTSSYTTIFIVNGLSFNAGIFEKAQQSARSSHFRVVGINRRGYAGSTHFTEGQSAVIMNGTTPERDALTKTIGIELLIFLDKFIQQNNIPELSSDGKSGGIALVGWSLGNVLTVPAIAHIDAVPADVRSRIASRLRVHIMHEPSANVLGLPPAEQNWMPLLDNSIPAHTRFPMFAQWVTSYFEHGDLSKRDPNVISYVLPSIIRVPSIFTMSKSQYDSIVDSSNNPVLDAYFVGMNTSLEANFRKATFDKNVRKLLPNMKTWFFTGDLAASFGVHALLVLQDENDNAGGGHINFKVAPGINHFVHWDDPEKSLELYAEILRA